MKTIYKYPLFSSRTILTLPEDVTVLSAQMQGNDTVVWIMLDTEHNHKTEYNFDIYGTGYKMLDNPGIFINTIQDGEYVWHVFWSK